MSYKVFVCAVCLVFFFFCMLCCTNSGFCVPSCLGGRWLDCTASTTGKGDEWSRENLFDTALRQPVTNSFPTASIDDDEDGYTTSQSMVMYSSMHIVCRSALKAGCEENCWSHC